MKKLLIICAGIISLLFVSFLLFMAIGKIPDSKAVTGKQLSSYGHQALIDSGIVEHDEHIYYFYSEGLTSFIEYGNLFTNTRVISYELDADTNERSIYTAKYHEISDIEFVKSNSLLEDSIIEIYIDDEWEFSLVVSIEESMDSKFHKKLVQVWQENIR